MSEKKYVLTEQEEVYNGNVYYQVKAVKTFKTIEGETVKAGTLGGFIQNESCLSQDGRCWVGKYSYVDADSIVRDDALLLRSLAKDGACICDTSNLDDAIVKGARVEGKSGLTCCEVEGSGICLVDAGVYYAAVRINGEVTLTGCRFTKVGE